MTANNPAPRAAATEPMSPREYRELLLSAIGPDLAAFRRMEAYDPNTIWRLDTAVVADLLREAIEHIDELTAEPAAAEPPASADSTGPA